MSKGKIRKRIQLNKRATQNNLSVDEKIVANLMKLHNINAKKAWDMHKKKLMFTERYV